MQRAWGCPAAGLTPVPLEALPTDQRLALVAIRKLTGCADLRTCPNAVLRTPGLAEAIDQACEAVDLAQMGQLRAKYRFPSQRLLDAMRVVRTAFAACKAETVRRATKSPPAADPASPAPLRTR
jgi:hypothetical protein